MPLVSYHFRSEPLSLDELRYSFAISQCPDKDCEQYLISYDGAMDTCGDFLRVSDGRYHMTHASISEFLTRPFELWQQEDDRSITFMSISYKPRAIYA
jgi:hypothetical protein